MTPDIIAALQYARNLIGPDEIIDAALSTSPAGQEVRENAVTSQSVGALEQAARVAESFGHLSDDEYAAAEYDERKCHDWGYLIAQEIRALSSVEPAGNGREAVLWRFKQYPYSAWETQDVEPDAAHVFVKEALYATPPAPASSGAGDALRTHFQRMMEAAANYLEPTTYHARHPNLDRIGDCKWVREFPMPEPTHAPEAAKSITDRRDQAFIRDLIYMLDGPEQREAFSTPLSHDAEGESAPANSGAGVSVLLPRVMTAAMINAWSNGLTVSSDENAARTTFQEAWQRVIAAAPLSHDAEGESATVSRERLRQVAHIVKSAAEDMMAKNIQWHIDPAYLVLLSDAALTPSAETVSRDEGLAGRLLALANDCDNTDGWEGAAGDLRAAAAILSTPVTSTERGR